MAKAFEFRLQKLLDLRRLEEEAAQRELAMAQKAVAERNRVIVRLLADEEQARDDLRLLQAGDVDIVRVRRTGEFLDSLGRSLDRERSTLRELETSEFEKRRRLTEALKGVRVLERFRERQLRRWREGLDREERKFLDEIGQNLAKGA